MEAKDALEQCVAAQDFSQASLLKLRILELESTKSNLLKEAEEPQPKEVIVEKVLSLIYCHFVVISCVNMEVSVKYSVFHICACMWEAASLQFCLEEV